jgi:hypothetical protein
VHGTVARVEPAGAQPAATGSGVAEVRADARPPVDGAGARAPHDALVASLRPRSVPAVLDRGVALLRIRPGRWFGLGAVLLLPIWLLDLVLLVTVGAETVERVPLGPSVARVGESAWVWLIVPLHAVALSLLGIAVGTAASAWRDGRDPTTGELLRAAFARTWTALVIVTLSALALLLASCVVGVGYLLAAPLVFTASIVAGAEGTGPLASLGRSASLARSAYGRALAMATGSLVLTQVVRFSCWLGPVALAGLLGAGEGVLVPIERIGGLVVVVVEPLTAAFALSAYLELRCRVEGLDLELRTREQFA